MKRGPREDGQEPAPHSEWEREVSWWDRGSPGRHPLCALCTWEVWIWSGGSHTGFGARGRPGRIWLSQRWSCCPAQARSNPARGWGAGWQRLPESGRPNETDSCLQPPGLSARLFRPSRPLIPPPRGLQDRGRRPGWGPGRCILPCHLPPSPAPAPPPALPRDAVSRAHDAAPVSAQPCSQRRPTT